MNGGIGAFTRLRTMSALLTITAMLAAGLFAARLLAIDDWIRGGLEAARKRMTLRGASTERTPSQAAARPGSHAASPAGGIVTLYPGDVGIEAHPNVVFVERFEEGTLHDVFSRWTDVRNGSSMSLDAHVPPGSPGSYSLDIPWRGGRISDGGHLYKQLSPGIDDTLYVRYYVKYPASGSYKHTGIWMGGFNPPLSWPNPRAGTKPDGTERFIAAAEQNTLTMRFEHYNYWMGMRQAVDGQYWGNFLLNNPDVQATTDEWTCVEHMVRLNRPASASNGEHAIWLNGRKVSHLGGGYPKGTWAGGVFTQNPAGAPFEGFRWRSDADLNLNWIWLQNYSPEDPAGFIGHLKFDHVVVATSYVGCLQRTG